MNVTLPYNQGFNFCILTKICRTDRSFPTVQSVTFGYIHGAVLNFVMVTDNVKMRHVGH